MRMGDVQLSFPTIMIAFFIDGVARIAMPLELREDLRLYVVILAIGVADWVQFARTVRAATMIERGKDYVAAARISRVPGWRILTRISCPIPWVRCWSWPPSASASPFSLKRSCRSWALACRHRNHPWAR